MAGAWDDSDHHLFEQDELADHQADDQEDERNDDGDPGRDRVSVVGVRDRGVIDRKRPLARLDCPCSFAQGNGEI